MAAWLQFGPVASGHDAAAGILWSAIQRIDGAKMFVLAAMAVALAVLSLASAVGAILRRDFRAVAEAVREVAALDHADR